MFKFQVSIAALKKSITHYIHLGDISRYPRPPPSQVIPGQGSGLQLRLGHEITIAPSSLITSRPWKRIYLLLSAS